MADLAGQYAGVGALVVVSAVAALGLRIVPERWVGLLGLLPFALGVKGLLAAVHRDGEPGAATVATGLALVAGVSIANGADNISECAHEIVRYQS